MEIPLRGMENNSIKIRGARVHNLKNIDVNIPRNKLVVITGISGSGKSSLAFDTIYAEGQRRYVESLSTYTRQFLGLMDKPDIDKIEGISPAIAIDQRKLAHNPRSTVGTITEIYDYLRLLFSRIGRVHCYKCGKELSKQTIDEIIEQILKLQIMRPGRVEKEISILGPMVREKKGEHQDILKEIKERGFVRVRIDGIFYHIEEVLEKELDINKKHNIEVVVDKIILDKDLEKSRLIDSVEIALKLGKGIVIINQTSRFPPRVDKRQRVEAGAPCNSFGIKQKSNDLIFNEYFTCEKCGISLSELEPRSFSFNSPYGACPACTGLGERLEVDSELVIPNKNLTIAEGAIRPFMRAFQKIGKQNYFWQQLSNLAPKYNFSLDDPVKDLSPKIINIILYGDGKFAARESGRASPSEAGWEGVIPNLEKKYHETASDWTRQEIEQYMIVKRCPKCLGKRLRPEALAVIIAGKSIDKIVEMSVEQIKGFFEIILNKPKNLKLKPDELKIANPIIKEIISRLQFLIDVGLNYLTLDRKAATLAGGEEQRIRLANQIGLKLTGVIYVLDEPSIGLHPRDQGKLINTLKKLRDLGNTVIIVEHDPQTIKEADWVIDIGPGAGKNGGHITFQGTPKQLLRSHTLTGDYLSGRKKVEIKLKPTPTPEPTPNTKHLIIKGAQEHNLKNIDIKIPLGRFICITGVSGSGKSSLVSDILAKFLLKKFYRAKEEPGIFKEILGIEHINKVVLVDQSPIGRTPRSNPATYTGAFSYIREIFSKTKGAKIKGYYADKFSFNIKGGRCESCEGQGQIKVEMYFLPDIYIECQECGGKRFNKEVLEIKYKGKNIAEILSLTVEEAMEFFKNIPGLSQKLKTLNEVGLSYLELGQPAPSLSGGEAQRIKLSTELSRKDTGKTLYILDEPTTGLHLDDIKKLIFVLRSLVDKRNTILCVEHNLSIISNADYVIDLGPEGGEEGGRIVAEGTPLEITKNKKSYTGRYLKSVIS